MPFELLTASHAGFARMAAALEKNQAYCLVDGW